MESREKANILLVDDQPGKLLSLESILQELGDNILKAGSADEALKELLEKEIPVVLIDVCMPRMDGFELAELIRTHPRFQKTAIIFISAVHLTDDDRLRGYRLGAVDYIPVPIIPEVLRAKVAVFTELYRKTNELERVNKELKQRVEELDASHERLRFSDRMATIGTLAAGLGHDMGNLLLPIRMRLDSLSELSLSATAREDLAAIRKASDYLQRLSSSLRLLALDAQSEENGDSGTDLAGWWPEAEGIIRTCVSRNATLTVSIAENLEPVSMGKASLTQLIFNLVQNAVDALRETADGRISISAERSPASAAARLTVSDNGPGMAEATRRRCLEPYFTTKTRELSTGLGLTLVAGLVQRANGTVSIQSELGKGTSFCVDIPFAPPPKRFPPATGGRRVAVVTLNDPRFLAHVRSVLASLDFEVRSDHSDEADIWVTEARDESMFKAAMDFAARRPSSRAVVFGVPSPRMAFQARVRCITPEFRPSLLRSQIQNALEIPGPGASTP
ncbi:MAG: response regulator [Phycisphaerales bacterium]|nr:response regulator [Planctomycetota bacterium]